MDIGRCCKSGLDWLFCWLSRLMGMTEKILRRLNVKVCCVCSHYIVNSTFSILRQYFLQYSKTYLLEQRGPLCLRLKSLVPLTNGCSSQISGAEAKQEFQFNNYNLFEREIVLVDHVWNLMINTFVGKRIDWNVILSNNEWLNLNHWSAEMKLFIHCM